LCKFYVVCIVVLLVTVKIHVGKYGYCHKMFVELWISLLLFYKNSLRDRKKQTFLYSAHSNYVKSHGLVHVMVTNFKFAG
jgi:hypothetical protein